MLFGQPDLFAIEVNPEGDNGRWYAVMRVAIAGVWMGPPERQSSSGLVAPVVEHIDRLLKVPSTPPTKFKDDPPERAVDLFWKHVYLLAERHAAEDRAALVRAYKAYELLPNSFEPLNCLALCIVRVEDRGVVSGAEIVGPDDRSEAPRLDKHRGVVCDWEQLVSILVQVRDYIVSVRPAGWNAQQWQ